MNYKNTHRDALILTAGQGRRYDCGTMIAIFKADEKETSEKYSISEWWLEPDQMGIGPHQHEANDEVFYVLEGTVSILVGDRWVNAEKGTLIRIPAKTTHDFANRTHSKAGVLNFFIPGGFERNMPSIVKWFETV